MLGLNQCQSKDLWKHQVNLWSRPPCFGMEGFSDLKHLETIEWETDVGAEALRCCWQTSDTGKTGEEESCVQSMLSAFIGHYGLVNFVTRWNWQQDITHFLLGSYCTVQSYQNASISAYKLSRTPILPEPGSPQLLFGTNCLMKMYHMLPVLSGLWLARAFISLTLSLGMCGG